MNVSLLIRQRFERLELEQRDLAIPAQVTESYISQLLTAKKAPPAPGRTDIYDKERRCREGMLLAEDDQRGTAERDIDSAVLSVAPVEREPVLLVAAQGFGQPGSRVRRCAAPKEGYGKFAGSAWDVKNNPNAG